MRAFRTTSPLDILSGPEDGMPRSRALLALCLWTACQPAGQDAETQPLDLPDDPAAED